jgi:hypothetical protein
VTDEQAAWLRTRVTQRPSSRNTLPVTHQPNLARAFQEWRSTIADAETVSPLHKPLTQSLPLSSIACPECLQIFRTTPPQRLSNKRIASSVAAGLKTICTLRQKSSVRQDAEGGQDDRAQVLRLHEQSRGHQSVANAVELKHVLGEPVPDDLYPEMLKRYAGAGGYRHDEGHEGCDGAGSKS